MMLVDFEIFCELDITEVGAWRYVEHESFTPILMSWCRWQGGESTDSPVHVADGEQEIRNVLRGQNRFAGWGQFDRIVLLRILGHGNFEYEDLMVRSAEVGYPLRLEAAAVAAKVKEHKDKSGRSLIPRFCKPMPNGERRMPETDPERWQKFRSYCVTDSRVARAIGDKTPPLTEREQELYLLDQKINQRGIRVDLESVEVLRGLAVKAEHRLNEIVSETTGKRVSSISDLTRMSEWLHELGVEIPDMQAATVEEWLSKPLPPAARTVLLARQAGAKASTKKLVRFLACTNRDRRIRGLLQFCGAHTRRWAGRLVQPQNFPRDSFTAEEFAAFIEFLRTDPPLTEVVRKYGSPLVAISKALRGLFIPKDGSLFFVVDYAAIEARILTWLADQKNVLDIYLSGGDVYVGMAARVFRKPESEITKEERFLGKTLVLGCGYMLGWKKLKVQLAKAGVVVDDDTAKEYIAAFRTRYGRVVALWENIRAACLIAVRERKKVRVGAGNRAMYFECRAGALVVTLPNGARLYYHDARVERVAPPWAKRDKDGNVKDADKILAVTAMMKDDKGWGRRALSPGLVTENVVQSIAREIMAAGMLRAERAGYPIVLTVHDEVIAEVLKPKATPAHLNRFEQLLCELEPWAAGLPLATEGKIEVRYGK